MHHSRAGPAPSGVPRAQARETGRPGPVRPCNTFPYGTAEYRFETAPGRERRAQHRHRLRPRLCRRQSRTP
ncbi:hypothetical protein EMIT0111MI5_240069 [Burkholderia sp. IT-111MI5]